MVLVLTEEGGGIVKASWQLGCIRKDKTRSRIGFALTANYEFRNYYVQLKKMKKKNICFVIGWHINSSSKKKKKIGWHINQ